MFAAKTHFEQVPLEIVRKIAERNSAEVPLGKERSTPKFETAASESQDLPYPDWQTLCHEALLEFDCDRLRTRVSAAEAAVVLRLQELLRNSTASEERQALADAVNSLPVLKTDLERAAGPEMNPEHPQASGAQGGSN